MTKLTRQHKTVEPDHKPHASASGISFLGQIYRNAKHRFSVAKSISISSTSSWEHNDEKAVGK